MYDALYAALSLELSLPLLTADERLVRAIRGHVDVMSLSDLP